MCSAPVDTDNDMGPQRPADRQRSHRGPMSLSARWHVHNDMSCVPTGRLSKLLSALLFRTHNDRQRGAVAHVYGKGCASYGPSGRPGSTALCTLAPPAHGLRDGSWHTCIRGVFPPRFLGALRGETLLPTDLLAVPAATASEVKAPLSPLVSAPKRLLADCETTFKVATLQNYCRIPVNRRRVLVAVIPLGCSHFR